MTLARHWRPLHDVWPHKCVRGCDCVHGGAGLEHREGGSCPRTVLVRTTPSEEPVSLTFSTAPTSCRVPTTRPNRPDPHTAKVCKVLHPGMYDMRKLLTRTFVM